MRPNFRSTTWASTIQTSCRLMAPHIVGFIRASKQAVSITFKIEDFYGEQVQQICKSPRDHMAIWCNVITLDLIRWIFDVLMSTKSIRDPCGFHQLSSAGGSGDNGGATGGERCNSFRVQLHQSQCSTRGLCYIRSLVWFMVMRIRNLIIGCTYVRLISKVMKWSSKWSIV